MAVDSILPPTLWRDITCEWLWVYRGSAPNRLGWSAEITVPAGIFFVESGSVGIRAEGNEMEVLPGQTFFSAPGTRQQAFTEGTRLLSVGMRCLWPDQQPVFSSGLNRILLTSELPRLHQATLELLKIAHPDHSEISYLESRADGSRSLSAWVALDAAYWTWFTHYVQTLERHGVTPTPRSNPADQRLKQLLHCLQTWPLNLALNMDEVASGLSLSSRRVHDLVRRELGMTAQAYLEKRRLDHARMRLSQEATPLKEIAFTLGFRHPPHFTAWFRRHTGMTPTDYRTSGFGEGA